MIVPQIVDDLYADAMDQAAWNRAFIGIADMVCASATLLLCVLFLFDPERDVTPRMELVAMDFGVSAREAEIAVLISMGLELSGVATRLSISIHAARTHLKSLYGKTGIRSQAELVRRVLSGPSAYAPTTS
jgi:DNA-binding CsgD family transcriptional regulator